MRAPLAPAARARRLTTLAAVALVVGAASCIQQDPFDPNLPNLRLLSGSYVVRRVNGDTLPVTVTTSAFSGTVTSGFIAIDGNSLEYRGTLTVRTAPGVVQNFTMRGSISQYGPRTYDSVYFENINYDRLSVAGAQASPQGMRLDALTLYGMRIEFFRAGPAAVPGGRS